MPRPRWPALDRMQRGDAVAGISVAMGVIPQSMAYAGLAGLPPELGLLAAGIPAIAAAFFVSSRYLQTGPAAVTSVMTLGALAPLALAGSGEFIRLAALLALVVGVTRIALGMLRMGVLAYLMSEPVLIGFTSAATLFIVAVQLPAALGMPGSPETPLSHAALLLTRWREWDPASPLLAGATVAIVLFARRIHPLIPGVLVAALLGIGFTLLSDYQGPVVGPVPGALPALSLALPWGSLPQVLLPGLAIALVGFAEPASIGRTLAARDRERWDADREFVSQGVANIAAGAIGAFPVGGSFSRSNLNRLAGARTRWSGAVTGVAVLAFVPFVGVVSALPRAVLAGIVIASVLNLIRLRDLVRLWSLARVQALVGSATFFATLLLAPRVEQAVLLGVLFAVAAHIYREMDPEVRHWTVGDTLHVAPRGVAFFGSVPVIQEKLLAALSASQGVRTVIIHMEGLGRVDLTGAMLLKQLLDDMESGGLKVELLNVPAHARKIAERVLGWVPSQSPERPSGFHEGSRSGSL